jgi:DNA/RNA-binding domain of Phe-tRNA-synthetase-like protein
VILEDLQNKAVDHEFETYKSAVLADLLARYRDKGFVKSDPILAEFRDLHIKVGRSNRRLTAAPEALISRLMRTGTMPRINLIVDIYNLISLKTRLSLGAHDVKKLDGDVSLRFTDGSEIFVPLGVTSAEPIPAGEYAYVDDHNNVLCRMECLQGDKTKVDVSTTDVFYIIQGNRNSSAECLRSALAELVTLTRKYCGGATSHHMAPGHPT